MNYPQERSKMAEKFNIADAVKELFGEDWKVEQARKFIEGQIQGHQDLSSTIKSQLSSIVNTYQNEFKKPNYRMAATLQEEGKYQIKSVDSIIEKMWRDRKKYTKDNFLEEMEDIIRFRILCNYLVDINTMQKKLPEEMTSPSGGYILHSGPKDFINKPPEERKKGHRAVHFVFKTIRNKKVYLFEVQLMTLLQDAWDKKDHHLVYEYERKNEEVPLDLRMRSYAMSEMLYLADEFFSSLLKQQQGE